MGKAQIAFGALFFTVGIISVTNQNSLTFARPTQSSIVFLVICGFSILLLRIISSTPLTGHATLPLQDRNRSRYPRDLSSNISNSSRLLFPRASSFLIATAVISLCLRIELFRIVLVNRQCTISGLEGCVPFLLAVYDCWDIQDTRPSKETAGASWPSKFIRGRARYLLPAAILSGASILSSYHANALRSTYICPHFASAQRIVPALQTLAALLDCYVLVSIDRAIRRRITNGVLSGNTASIVLGSTFLLSAAFLSLGGLVAFVTHPAYWKWVLGVDKVYFINLAWDTLLCITATLCALEIYSIYGLLHTSFIVTFVTTYVSGFADELSKQDAFAHFTQASSAVTSLVLFLGAALYLHIKSLEAPLSFRPTQSLVPRISFSPYAILTLLLIARGFYQFPRSNLTRGHPIGILMRNAESQSQAWLAQASASKTLADAIENYRRRYRNHPPPGFDVWYKYATERSSLVIDDYDSIYKDLLPFWAVDPLTIRSTTRAIISDQWNEVAEVIIRSGKAEIGPNVVPTHRWMLEGVLAMMQGFVQWLPDMDLAFNINDEPRIAIPWKSLQRLRDFGTNAQTSTKEVSVEWSLDRASTWRPLGETEPHQRPFEDHSFANSFADYGSIACPPTSHARRLHPWDPSTLCATCAAPHSLGLFLSNWTLASSPCHQPDLAHLHGFYLSPAAFKPSHALLPVFSQSKAHGYADILYPSAWNYMDKVKYDPSDLHPDPPFTEKENTLFWRGATSEGLSKHATWKGMARQRLVHLANNATHPLPVLLPHPTRLDVYTYTLLPPSALDLHLDIAIVDDIARCWDNDCADQVAELGLAPRSDFQAHWRRRFLFDLDGAGFSGRFLPFLQSRSLVFKTAVFREWWDARVVAWRHFVPVDVRFHGLLATLAYFAGAKGAAGANPQQRAFAPMAANLRAGEEIAEAGRELAEKMLRKEDMEVYLFRLLLEWGRLTDDRRGGLGFGGGEGEGGRE